MDTKAKIEFEQGRRQAIREGLTYTASVSPSYLVFGTVCGLASKQAGFDLVQALALPALVFGGSAQIVITSLIVASAPLLIVVLSGVIVNSRMAVYSAILSGWMRGRPQQERTAVAALIVDQTYAGTQAYRDRTPDSAHWQAYYFAAGISLWLWWLGCNLLGYVAGAVVPAGWELDFAVPLSFVAVLAPIVKRLPMAVAATLGALLGIVFFALPLKLGLIAACIVGVFVMTVLNLKFRWIT